MIAKKIESCRQAALTALKPSKRDLARGMALRADAPVWDAYGFVPWSPYRAERIEALIAEGAGPRELEDAREADLSLGVLESADIFRDYRAVWDATGLDGVYLCAGEESNAIPRLLKRFARFTYLIDAMPAFFRRCVFANDMVATKGGFGRRGLCLSINGVPLPTDLDNVETALSWIETFFQLGCRMTHLTYNRRNLIGDGCGEATDGGLSDFGRQVVRELNRVGIIPDGAHTGNRTIVEAAAASVKPVVISHAVCAALAPGPRAKSDEAIAAVAKSGGYIGICAQNRFVGGSEDIRAFLDHIDYAVDKFGAEHVAIGTDKAFYLSDHSPRAAAKRRPAFEALWPPGSVDSVRRDEYADTLALTNWPLFIAGLVQRGHSDDDIRKIIGGNILRVARETFPTPSLNAPAMAPNIKR